MMNEIRWTNTAREEYASLFLYTTVEVPIRLIDIQYSISTTSVAPIPRVIAIYNLPNSSSLIF